MIKYLIKRYSKRKIIILFGDIICLIIAASIAVSFAIDEKSIVYVNPFGNILKILMYLFESLLTIISFRFLNLYKERNYFSGSNSITLILKGILISSAVFIVLTFFFKYEDISENSRFSIVAFTFASFFFVFSTRYIFIKISRGSKYYNIFNRNILAIGAGVAGSIFAKQIKLISNYLILVGFVDDDSEKIGKEIENVKVLGNICDIQKIVDENAIDEIFITIKSISYDKLMDIIEHIKPTRCQINLLSPHFGIVEKRFDSKEYTNFQSVPINAPVSIFYSNYIKRVFDIVIAFILLIILSPIFFIIAILILLTSKGPIFYKTKVIGKEGKEFTWFKFRTMKNDNKNEIHKVHLKNIIEGNKSVEKITNDLRITMIGKLLRKYSFDEFPQLINVIKGDMALIGPRPCLPYEYEMMDDWHKRRTKVIPGMSGLWQVLGRNKSDVSFNDSLILDLYYIDNLSFWLDIKIFFKTIPVVLLGKGGK